jgi:hypothetical protein
VKLSANIDATTEKCWNFDITSHLRGLVRRMNADSCRLVSEELTRLMFSFLQFKNIQFCSNSLSFTPLFKHKFNKCNFFAIENDRVRSIAGSNPFDAQNKDSKKN